MDLFGQEGTANAMREHPIKRIEKAYLRRLIG
jgi:hypothetical protein